MKYIFCLRSCSRKSSQALRDIFLFLSFPGPFISQQLSNLPLFVTILGSSLLLLSFGNRKLHNPKKVPEKRNPVTWHIHYLHQENRKRRTKKERKKKKKWFFCNFGSNIFYCCHFCSKKIPFYLFTNKGTFSTAIHFREMLIFCYLPSKMTSLKVTIMDKVMIYFICLQMRPSEAQIVLTQRVFVLRIQ